MLTKHDVTKMICNTTEYSLAAPVNLHRKDTFYMQIIIKHVTHQSATLLEGNYFLSLTGYEPEYCILTACFLY